MKIKVFALIIAILTIFCTAIPISCSNGNNLGTDKFFTSVTVAQANGETNSEPTLNSTPSQNTEISLLSGDIYDVCKDYEWYITDNYNPENKDVFAPTPLKISWQSKSQPLYYVLDVSTSADMSNAKTYVTFDNNLTFDYLFMGYTYYYQIQAKFENRIVKSRIFKFSTAYLPRTVYVDDKVSNTRDWGGYYSKNGTHRLRQGIVYRGGKLEEITPKGKEIMLVDLGIKTDLDVRGDGSAQTSNSPLGNSVNYIETTGPYYYDNTHGINVDGTYRQALVTEIKAFANPDNFPIYVHCSLGRDRTGTICFLIQALCGVNDADMLRDYEISMMSSAGRADNQTAFDMINTAFRGMYNYVRYYTKSGSLADNVEAFMLDIGITKDEISAIKSNMLEEIK